MFQLILYKFVENALQQIMLKFLYIISLLLVIFNSISFLYEPSEIYKILGHMLFFPTIGLVYGFLRDWQFGKIDQRIFLVCLIGCIGDGIIFFVLNEKGEFLQLVSAFFVHFIFINIFRNEGAYVFNIAKINILKVLVPALIVFFFFGFVLLPVLPNVLYFMVIFYAIEVAILVVIGYFRPVSENEYWLVAVGVTLLLLKDILYSYFFFVFKSNQHLLYIPFYIFNASAYFLIIYGIAINQNTNKEVHEKISIKLIINIIHSLFKKKIKSNIFDSIFLK